MKNRSQTRAPRSTSSASAPSASPVGGDGGARAGVVAGFGFATHHDVIGLFFHDSVPGDDPHDAVEQELVAVFCSLLGALLESAHPDAHRRATETAGNRRRKRANFPLLG